MAITWSQPNAPFSGIDKRWQCGDVSNDGKVMMAGTFFGGDGFLYRSDDYGASFSKITTVDIGVNANGYWQVKLNSDGNRAVTIVQTQDDGSNFLYYNNSSWTRILSGYDNNATTCAIDYDGTSVLMGGHYNTTGLFLYSGNSGIKLDSAGYMGNATPTGEYYWENCAINGGKIIAHTDYRVPDGVVVIGEYPYTTGHWTKWNWSTVSNDDRYNDCTVNKEGTKFLLCGLWISGYERAVFAKESTSDWGLTPLRYCSGEAPPGTSGFNFWQTNSLGMSFSKISNDSSLLSSLQQGLVGHWALDSATGTTDLSTGGHSGTAYGGMAIGGAIGRTGEAGTATTFITDDYIQFSGSANSPLNITGDEISISYWIYPNSAKVFSMVVNKDSVDSYQYSSYYENNKFFFLLGIEMGEAHSTVNTYPLYNWYHVVNVYNGAKMKIFVNTIQDLDHAITGNIETNSYKDLGIGAFCDTHFYPEPAHPNSYMNGILSDVRIYDRALTSNEIACLYTSTSPTRILVGSTDTGFPQYWNNWSDSTTSSGLDPYGDVTPRAWHISSMDGIGQYLMCGAADGLLFVGINDDLYNQPYVFGPAGYFQGIRSIQGIRTLTL